MELDIDWSSIGALLFIIVAIGTFVFVAFIARYEYQLHSYSDQCAKNPSLLYAHTCTTKEDCLSKCEHALKDGKT